MITVHITAEDIATGARWSAFGDPVTIAICRATGRSLDSKDVSTSRYGIVIGSSVFPTPALVAEFIEEFDAGHKVIPFTFDLWAPGEQEVIG